MRYGDITHYDIHNSSNSYTSEVFRDLVHILWFQILYTSDGTVGNRAVGFVLYEPDGDIIWDSRSAANQGAGLLRHYSTAPGFPRETSFSGNDDIYMPMPPDLIIPNGGYFKVFDSANVSPTDSFVLIMQTESA